MFRKILVANRGEIALRVIRACRELGIPSVAVHSEADAEAMHVRFADEAVCIGPTPAAESYLHVPAIIAAAEVTGADAIHPGYGFLSENALFAETCGRCGLTFVGPTADDMARWGNKVQARALARELGIPLMEGSGSLEDADSAVVAAEKLGYPVMLKAAGGGGGRGMKIVHTSEEMRRVFPQARAEAIGAFNDGELFIERYLAEPRHIEFQILADGKGDVLVLGERECSIQRRHQKVIEEAPSVAMSAELRADMVATITRAIAETGYRSAGTLEFLMDERGELTFLEMNTRVQVEHPVSEMVTGVDLIVEQIRVAAGEPILFPVRQLQPRGHSIECRINAEDPVSFAPWPGKIDLYHAPAGPGVRVDDGVYSGWRIPSAYDSLIAKVITHGRTRLDAIQRMKRALAEMVVDGIRTNIPLHQRILADDDFVAGRLSTRFLERMLAR